ncbi:HPF/RaiA family ribosome-associated protein [Immundisolibacter sp.]
MRVPLAVSHRNLEGSPAIEEHIHQRVQKLEKPAPDLIACQVVSEEPHRHHHQGRIYHLRLEPFQGTGARSAGASSSTHTRVAGLNARACPARWGSMQSVSCGYARVGPRVLAGRRWRHAG